MERIDIVNEAIMGAGPLGEFYLGDALQLGDLLTAKYGGRVQCVYLDPPFYTGETFQYRARVGEAEWKSGKGSLAMQAYSDRWTDRDSYIDVIRQLAALARDLLSDTGMLFLHCDYRVAARLRIMLDELFGESNFLNEIIWTYQTGGRARRYFSRKHDVILFYRKTDAYKFYIENVPVSRTESRRNHMKQQVDKDGRLYRTIMSGGKLYKYYDDEPVFPGDVWDDVSHLQQKDPQRTGYDTQKPLKLLERIVLCSTQKGDTVCDLCCGSGTTLEAAALADRSYFGVDISPLAMQVVRRRMIQGRIKLHAPGSVGEPEAEVSALAGVGFYELYLNAFKLEAGACEREISGLDAVAGWSAGYLIDDTFYSYVHDVRAKQHPALDAHLQLPVWDGQPGVRIEDVLGRVFYYKVGIRS